MVHIFKAKERTLKHTKKKKNSFENANFKYRYNVFRLLWNKHKNYPPKN